jgi:hypothetical protein
MSHESSEFDSALPPSADNGEATRTFLGPAAPSRPQPAEPATPSPYAPTEVMPPHPPTEVVRQGPGVPANLPVGQPGQAAERAGRTPEPEIVRYGPGVPASPPADQAELTAERVWRSSGPARPSRRQARLRRLFATALTVILLAASGVILYLRFHHAPFHVTGVVISQQTPTGCGVNVTGRITTNGSAGTVSYQWLFRPGRQAPQPLSQSVAAGQPAVYVTVALQGSGHGSAAQTVTLQVLGPDLKAASTAVVVSCR